MGTRRLRTIEIEHADRGVVIHVTDSMTEGGETTRYTEIVEGYGNSVNFQDRIRRRVVEIVTGWYPTRTKAPKVKKS